MHYEPDYAGWRKLGFLPTTPIVRKRNRQDGLLDVLVLQTNGCYSAWVSERRNIWFVVWHITTWDGLQDEDDLRTLISRFSTSPLPVSPSTPSYHAAA